MGMLTVEFLALVAGALLLFHASRAAWWRRGVLSCASMVFALSYAGNGQHMPWSRQGALSLLPLFAFTLAGFMAMRAARALPAWPLALAVVAAYASLRHAAATQGEPQLMVTVGMSYILFRILHLLFDLSQGGIAVVPTLPGYLAFVFFFPTFLSGPIWKYDEYRGSLDSAASRALDGGSVFPAFSRIANGGLKVLILSRAAHILHGSFVDTFTHAAPDDPLAALFFVLAALAYLVHLYFDFSGSMDMVIGVGALFGLGLPENFNAPFQSSDIIDFWSRWHITLSKWMQQYVFTPLVAWLSRRFLGSVRIQHLGAVGYLAVFLIIGLWHEASLRFLCFGLTLGIAASITKLWDSLLMKRFFPGKMERAVREHIVHKKFMNALAVFIVSLALSFLWAEPGISHRLDFPFIACGLATGLLAAGATGILERFFRETMALVDRPGILRARSGIWALLPFLASELWLAVRCITVFGILAVHDSDMPVFIYQGF